LIKDCALDLDATPGITCHRAVESMHSEIVGLTALKVGKLTHVVSSQFFKKTSLTEADVLTRVVDAVLNDRTILDSAMLEPDLRDRILDEIDKR
jgi:hypothetical protein